MENFVGKNPSFLHPEATSLAVIACWAVGSIYLAEEYMTDDSYRVHLKTLCGH